MRVNQSQAYADGILQHHIQWDSVTECLEDARTLASARKIDRRGKPRTGQDQAYWHWQNFGSSDHYGRWNNIASESALMALLDTPDPTALAAVSGLRDRINASTPQVTRAKVRRLRRRNQEEGTEIQPDRFMARDPEMWERMDRIPQPSKIIRVAVEYSIASHCNREDMLPRGAALLAVTDWLAINGYSVEISGVFTNGRLCSGLRSMAEVLIKRAGTPFDLGNVCTAVCEIAYCRLAVLCAQVLRAPGTTPLGMGSVSEMYHHEIKAMGFDLTVPSTILSEGAAIVWVESTVAKLEAGDLSANVA